MNRMAFRPSTPVLPGPGSLGIITESRGESVFQQLPLKNGEEDAGSGAPVSFRDWRWNPGHNIFFSKRLTSP